MKLGELHELLRHQPVPEDAYVIDEEPKDESYVLARDDGGWSVYYAERGLRSDERTFVTEDEACADLLLRLGRDFAFDHEQVMTMGQDYRAAMRDDLS